MNLCLPAATETKPSYAITKLLNFALHKLDYIVYEGQNADVFNFAKGTLSGRKRLVIPATNHLYTEAFVNLLFCENTIFRLFGATKREFEPTSCKQGNQDGIRKTRIQIIPNSVC